MTGQPHTKFIADRKYADHRTAMARFLEIANGVASDHGRILISLINRTMLDDGASVGEYVAARDLAIAEGYVDLHPSGAYVIFTQKGADSFA